MCLCGGGGLTLITALDGGGVQRERGDGVHGQHRRAAAVAAVIRFQIAVTFVAGVDAVALVAAGERRDP